jgi:hypothetical protein
MWAARPLLRSIRWDPVPPVTPPDMEGAYEVFIMQSALEELLTHLAHTDDGEFPFGLLAGDICEDPDEGTRYVQISGVCPSRVSLSADATIPPDAWEALQKDLEDRRVQGSLVGWYLRHPAGDTKLSEHERDTHARYFSERWHSALVIVTDTENPAGGFFRSTARGFSTVALPFHEVVTAESLTGGERHTLLDWNNATTDGDVPVQAAWRDPDAGEAERGKRFFARKKKKNEPSGPAGAIVQEAARRAIAAAASKTAADLVVKRREAEASARKADEEAARRAEELQAAQRAAEEAARQAEEEASEEKEVAAREEAENKARDAQEKATTLAREAEEARIESRR